MTLWQITVGCDADAAPAVVDILEAAFATPPSTYTDAETERCFVSVYLPLAKKPTAPQKQHLQASVANLGHQGVQPPRIRVQRLEEKAWAEAWRRHFKPISLGAKLLIKPSWSRQRPRRGQAVVVLDPGLAFGTGQHPTTDFCLRQIARGVKPLARSFLDLGSGSGILAIAAARLGYKPVHAVDNDPVCIRVGRRNAKANRLLGSVQFRIVDLTSPDPGFHRRYDLVCANLIYDLLLQERSKIIGLVEPGGALVLAGILSRQFAQVRRAYENAGWKLVQCKEQKEWTSGLFRNAR